MFFMQIINHMRLRAICLERLHESAKTCQQPPAGDFGTGSFSPTPGFFQVGLTIQGGI